MMAESLRGYGHGYGHGYEAGHPYYPVDVPIPQFRANETDLIVVLASFGGIAGAVVVSSWIAAGRGATKTALDRFAVCWFALCKLSRASFILPSPFPGGGFPR